ncbi:MAG: hypothetical protein B7Z37_17075 [Verrucomicrobia bacterium 12-59-8]|nr:MAG: hypothetical protein B7Z37_17075 [Verrucomicrobia bacterium 12-59-8]
MNDSELNRMLKHAATATSAAVPHALEQMIMERVRSDDGRARRWRSFVQWLLLLAALSGIVTAGAVGWAMASRDTTHTTPPTMELFRTGEPQ